MPEPSIIGKYKIEGRLGQGGMGAVYLARDTRIGRLVALKVLRVDNEEMRNRFELEAQSAGRLKHPNIVTIHDYEEYDGNPCLVMEYVEGHTLAEMIQRGQPIPIAQQLDYVEQVCRGLSFAHAAGIVHRDIKPSNLMLDQHGVMKILDFGIARNSERGLTRSRRMVGTAGYMSPEQVRGDKVDQRCDVFAVGLVLYEFLSGRRAFPGENEYSVFDRILNGSPDPFDHPDTRVFEGVSPILDTALQRVAEDRYQTATALRLDLASLRQRFENDMGPAATVVTLEPVTKTTPPRVSRDERPATPAPIVLSPDHTPTREATQHGSRGMTPAPVVPTPAPTPKRMSLAVILAAVAWTVLAGIVVTRYALPLLTSTTDRNPPAVSAPPNPAPSTPPAGAPAASPAPATGDSGGSKPAVPPPAPPSVTAELARARQAFDRADYRLAIAEYDAALKIDPTNRVAADGKADVQKAIKAEQTVLNPKPAVPALTPAARKALEQHVTEGQRLHGEGEYDAAIKEFQAALALDSSDKRASSGIARATTAKAAEEKFLKGTRPKPPS
ncbi:MAG: serine/threonine-protein kinase [Acidobacteriota bacterium]|nr:serine/threonine-protein kinase [Acidobacteriota bacterium]